LSYLATQTSGENLTMLYSICQLRLLHEYTRLYR